MTDIERNNIKVIAAKHKDDDRISFICEHCGKETALRAALIRKKELLLCPSCAIKYGKSKRTPEQKELTRLKTIETCEKKYGKGVINGGGSEESKKKARETWIKNWGSEEECFKQRSLKAQETFKTEYNGTYSTPEILEKKRQGMIKNSGSVENSYRLRTIKSMETNRKNHGGLINLQTEEFKNKTKETLLKNTGYDHPMKCTETKDNMIKKYGRIGGTSSTYKYDNILFDSSWELAFYIYLKDNNIDFKYHSIENVFSYKDTNGEDHIYTSDFIVNGVQYDIKGSQFFNKDGEPYNKYTNEFWWDKYNLILSFGVKFLKYDEYKNIEKYIFDKYGKKYLKQFKYTSPRKLKK